MLIYFCHATYRTLLIQGSDCNLYASGSNTYLGNGNPSNISTPTILAVQPPVSSDGIKQIEAGFNSFLVLDGNGTIHVLGENSEGSLGTGNMNDQTSWSKVGNSCSGGILGKVVKISTLSTHDYRSSSSAILEDGTIRSWGMNNRNAITGGLEDTRTCPILPTGIVENVIAIANGGHITPYVNSTVQICNIGHNGDGAFGDGNVTGEHYHHYTCFDIPGHPEVCGTNEGDVIETVPIFNQLGPYCLNDIPDQLPNESSDLTPFTGIWIPNEISTSTQGITTYTFIPDTDQCLAIGTATMDIEVLEFVLPQFTELGLESYCVNDFTDILPNFSENDIPISGTWIPPTISTEAPGWTSYHFNSSENCIQDFQMDVFVEDCNCLNPASIQIESIAAICEGKEIDLLAVYEGSATSMTWETDGSGTIANTSNETTSYLSGPGDAASGVVTFTATTNDPDGPNESCLAAVATAQVIIHPIPQPPTSTDVILCQGDISSKLTAIGNNIIWFDEYGIELPEAPKPSTVNLGVHQYSLTQSVNGCESEPAIVSVTITAYPEIDAGSALQLECDMKPISLEGSSSFDASEADFLWTGQGIFAGENTLNPTVELPGIYTLTVNSQLGNCVAIDEVEVSLDETVPVFDLIMTPSCIDNPSGSIVVSDISEGLAPYEVMLNGVLQNGKEFLDLKTGEYTINVTDANGCSGETTVEISTLEDWSFDVSTNKARINQGQSTNIITTLNNIDTLEVSSVLWEPNIGLSCTDCLNPLASPDLTTTYMETIIDENGCSQVLEVLIYVNPSIIFPNAISPNEDGINDRFYPIGSMDEAIVVQELYIFNRWGNVVFFNESFPINDSSNGWDGTRNGKKCEIGIYAYLAKIKTDVNTELLFSGNITVVK